RGAGDRGAAVRDGRRRTTQGGRRDRGIADHPHRGGDARAGVPAHHRAGAGGMSGSVGGGAGAAAGARRASDRRPRGDGASRLGIMAAIVRKDLLEFSRDRLWMVLTPVALVMFVGLYWLLPATVDETITVAVTPPGLARALTMAGGDAVDAGGAAGAAGAVGASDAEGGLRFAVLESEEEVASAVRGERTVEVDGAEVAATVGLVCPQDFLQRAAAGEPSTVRVYVDAAVPPEIRDAMTSAVREMAF